MQDLTVESIETVERLLEIELAWDELYRADPHATVYLCSDFITAVAIRAAGKYRVLVVWDGQGRCLGLLPLLVTAKWRKKNRQLINVIDMLGHVFDADYTGWLCHPERSADVAAMLAASITNYPFARLILNYVSAPSQRLAQLTDAFDPAVFGRKANEHFSNDGQTNNRICPYIELPGSFDGYLAGLSSNTRQKLRRLLRNFDADPSLKIRRSRPETYTQDVTVLSRLWYLKHAAQKGEQRAARLAEVFKEVVMLGLASGRVYLALLYRDGRPVAAQANYLDHCRGQVLFHVAGRDDSVRDLSVGLLLQAHCIRWAIANGFSRYDFTIGDEPYKFSLGAIAREIFSAEVFTHSGTNHGNGLDALSRGDCEALVKQLTLAGRDDEAAAARAQVRETWPD